jgi:hypothetical protein
MVFRLLGERLQMKVMRFFLVGRPENLLGPMMIRGRQQLLG